VAAQRLDIRITGMTCAACAARVERGLRRAPGVQEAAVNLATARATVEFDPAATDLAHLTQAVEAAGYGTAGADQTDEELRRREYAALRARFVVALALSVPVLFIGMLAGSVPALASTPARWLQLILATPVLFYSGGPFFRAAWRA